MPPAKSAQLDALIAAGKVNSAGQQLSRQQMYATDPRMQRLYAIVERGQQPAPPAVHEPGTPE